MMLRRWAGIFGVLALIVAGAACTPNGFVPGPGSSGNPGGPAANPTPSVTSLSPSSATAGGAAFTLTVNGSSFVSGATVDWNGSARTTTFVSSTQLTAAIPATDIAAAGTVQVTAVNPSPGGGASNAATFTVNNPVPAISSLSPSSATAGGPAFTLTVNGSSFASGATVDWNGSARTTTFVSSTQLTAAIPATDIAAAGTADVTVVNPTPGGGTSNTATFTITAATSGAGVTERVSVASDGTQGNNASFSASISADGRFVAFSSFADNLVAGDTNGQQDNFVRDTCQGATGCTPSTTLVSVASDGTQGNSASSTPSISADGRFVAFSSVATNLVAGDTNGREDIFVRDTCQGATGCTLSTIRVSVASDGTQGNSDSDRLSISGDGRFVAFSSVATNLVAGGTNGNEDIFVRDTCQGATGCTPSTTLVSVASDGTQGNSSSDFPSISADGRFVAFTSVADNLVAGDTNGQQDIFVRDTCQGATGCTPSTTLVSVASDGTQGNNVSAFPSMSADGRFVAFTSGATNLVTGDTNGVGDIFVRDTCQGATGCTPSTIRVSVASDGTQGNFGSFLSSISGDGRFVAFSSVANNLVAGDTNGNEDIFVRDTCQGATGCTPSTIRVSVASDGTQGNNPSISASISGDGHFVAFTSGATNLVTGDTNAAVDVFLAATGF